MRNPINKSNLRRPLKMVLLIFMVFIISNTSISRLSQFVIVNREINRIGSYYKSIGTVQPINKEQAYINEAQLLLKEDSMIDYEDHRRTSQGIIDGLPNTNINQSESTNPEFYDYTIDDYKVFLGDVIFTATVDEVYQAPSAEDIYDGLVIKIKVKELIAGFPDYIKEGTYTGISVAAKSLRTGDIIKFINNDVIDDLLTLEPGESYLFRAYWDSSLRFTMIKPLYTRGPLYEKLGDDGGMDLTLPKWEELKEDIDVLNENIQSFSITTTKDMTAMPTFQAVMKDQFLKEGRLLNQEDDINQNYVCVINEHLSEMRNIKIGDKLDIKMRNTEKGWSYLATEKDIKEWKSYNTSDPISFEVVGIYADKQRFATNVGRNIYIPDSTLPKDFGYHYQQGLSVPDINSFLYSFTLQSSEYESEFIKRYEEPLKEMGYSLYFIENNAESFWNSAKAIKQSSLISAILFSFLLLLVFSFVVYIYVEGHKINYAIERALGIPSRVCGMHLMFPLMVFGYLSSMTGGFLGYISAINISKKLLSDLADFSMNTINSELELRYLFIFISGLLLLLTALLLFRVNQLRKTSVIELINSHNVKKKTKKEALLEKEENNLELDLKFLGGIDYNSKNVLPKGNKDTLRRFSFNHSIRSKATSLLLLSLAGTFIFSLLWMNYLIIKNNAFIDKAYNETEIAGELRISSDGEIQGTRRGPISGTQINNMLETGLVKDFLSLADMTYSEMYIKENGFERKYEMTEEEKKAYHIPKASFNVLASNKLYNSDSKVNLTNLNLIDGYNIEDFFKNYKVDFTDGANPKIVDEKGSSEIPVLVSEKALKDFQLKIGDNISLAEESRDLIKAYGTIVGIFKELDMADLHEYLENYTTITKDKQSIFIYPLSALQAIERNNVHYRSLSFEFKPESNRELLDRKDELKNIVVNNIYDDIRSELKLWDEELTNVVEPLEKGLSLLEVLYPITFGLSIIIAGILAFMMVIGRSTDVAILRMLGVKSKEVEWILFRENILLVLIGIIISAIIIIPITINTYPIGLDKYVMAIGGYLLGTIIGLMLSIGKVTKKKPLEMLQVKE